MGKQRQTLTVEIDSDLAAKYRAAYVEAFGSHERDQVTLARFMATFVEDRLCEEIEFLERETIAELK